VPESNTLYATKQAALQAVAHMTRPEGMSRVTWRGVHALLGAIARCYPKAYPSQRTLAARLDVSVATVKRYVAAAVKANLLVVTPDAGAAPRKTMGSRTNRYHIVHGLNLSPEEYIFSFGEDSGASPQETSSPRTQRGPSGSTVIQMRPRFDDDASRDITTTADEAPRPSKHSVRPTRPPADEVIEGIDSGRRAEVTDIHGRAKTRERRLSNFFMVIWDQMCLDQPEFRTIRCLETHGEARMYIKNHLDKYTEVEVRQMMREFVIAVSKRDITIKAGQSAWKRFTGTWGRQRQVTTGDPYAAYRSKEMEQ
jgi:hypothetical protein